MKIYDKATDDTLFGFVSTRYGYVDAIIGTMHDVFQGYMRGSATATNVLAFNLSSYHDKTTEDFSQRTVVIANVENNKFAVKTESGIDPVLGESKLLVAIGKGGVDATTGAYVTGYFVVVTKPTTASTPKVWCISNSANPQIVADTNCSGIVTNLGTTASDGWTAADLTTYLGLNATDTTYLTHFINGDTYDTTTALKNTTNIGYPAFDYGGGHFPTGIFATQ